MRTISAHTRVDSVYNGGNLVVRINLSTKYMQVLLRGNPIVAALTASVAAMVVLALTLVLAEPVVSHGASDTDEFTVTQEITGGISFLSPANDVVMDTTINGVTGGSSLGTSTFNVSTNNSSGYTVTIQFEDVVAMQATGSAATIPNYTPVTPGEADYNFSVPSGGEFGYTAYNVTTPADTDAAFQSGGASDCDNSGTVEVQQCWYNQADAQTPKTIINSNDETSGEGATSTVIFQVGLAADSGIESGWYMATATLTATTQ
jgi:hypothetical protein